SSVSIERWTTSESPIRCSLECSTNISCGRRRLQCRPTRRPRLTFQMGCIYLTGHGTDRKPSEDSNIARWTEGEDSMKLKDYLLPEIEREIDRSRRALEQVPADKYDWKPHEKSMAFGYLVNMVATIPIWITLEVNQDELDIAPADGGNRQQNRLNT